MSDQPPPPHPLSEAQRLMGHLRAAQAGGAGWVPTESMVRLADLLTDRIQQLQGELAQSQIARSHAEAMVGFYRTMTDEQPKVDRQIERAAPPKQPTEDGGA